MDNPYQPTPGSVPPGPGKPVGAEKPKNYLVEAIFCLVCCGGLLAIPAIVYAAQVDSKYTNGDFQGAVKASANAKKWCIIAVCVALLCGGLGFLLQIVMVVAGAAA